MIDRLLEQMEGGSVGGITTVNISFQENTMTYNIINCQCRDYIYYDDSQYQ